MHAADLAFIHLCNRPPPLAISPIHHRNHRSSPPVDLSRTVVLGPLEGRGEIVSLPVNVNEVGKFSTTREDVEKSLRNSIVQFEES